MSTELIPQPFDEVTDRLPTLSDTAAAEYATALGCVMTRNAVIAAMHRGDLTYTVLRHKRATSKAAVREWLLTRMSK